jgi:hypothetical protein
MLLRIDGQDVGADVEIPFLLARYRQGQQVTIATTGPAGKVEHAVTLTSLYSSFDTVSGMCIGGLFMFFGIYVLFRYRRMHVAAILHAIATGTAVMIVYDWGSLQTHSSGLNLALRALFDLAIWLLPVFFLHFSFLYPHTIYRFKRTLLFPAYAIAAAGAGLSLHSLFEILIHATPVQYTDYIRIHMLYNDIFLIVALLCTVAMLERSAMLIPNARERANVYWVLLGVVFGPLVYVFLILAPRILLGTALLSDSAMQYSLLVAPVMFLKALRATRQGEVQREREQG